MAKMEVAKLNIQNLTFGLQMQGEIKLILNSIKLKL